MNDQAKTAVITGAARGIGAAIALAFAKRGANLVLNYRSSLPDELTAAIKETGAEYLGVQGDISKFADAETLIKAAKDKFGRIDCLVNNAGITRDQLLLRMTESDFDEVLATNLKGAFNTIKHVSPIMLRQKSGAIINISSVVGISGNIGQANYAASKAGLIGLTKSVAKELGSRGITCNAVAPGFIESDMTAKLPDELREKMLQSIPLGRYGKPEEVAELCLFLERNRYITGQTISIDGGMI